MFNKPHKVHSSLPLKFQTKMSKDNITVTEIVSTTVALVCSTCKTTYTNWPLETSTVLAIVMRCLDMFKQLHRRHWEIMTKEDVCLVVAHFIGRAESVLRGESEVPAIRLKARISPYV